MKIAFDFDGVIAEINKYYAEFAKGIDEKAEKTSLIQDFLASPIWKEYTQQLKPMKGINRLRKIIVDTEVHIISRRLESDREILLAWLKKYKITVPSERIHLRENMDTSEIQHKIQYAKVVDSYYDDREWVVSQIPNARLFKTWEVVENEIFG